MVPENGSDIVRPVTPKCYDDKVIALLKTASFSKLKIDWDHYYKCIKDQDKALTAITATGSFLDRDRDLEKYVGVIQHPAISI